MTSEPMLVSVVTPSYQMADRLEACIASVRSQTYPHVEHIIVDGGSSDGTVELLERSTGIVWSSEPDAGQSDALAKGFSRSRGDLLTWLNADDQLAPDAVALAVTALAGAPTAVLAYGDVRYVTAIEEWIQRPPVAVTFDSLTGGNVLLQPGSFFRRDAYERVGGIDPTFHLTMDFDLWLRLLVDGAEAVYMDEVTATFEIHESSKTGTSGAVAFAAEEARALLKAGQPLGAVVAMRRATREAAIDGLLHAVQSRDNRGGRTHARAGLASYDSIIDRGRAMFLLGMVSPRTAARLAQMRRRSARSRRSS